MTYIYNPVTGLVETSQIRGTKKPAFPVKKATSGFTIEVCESEFHLPSAPASIGRSRTLGGSPKRSLPDPWTESSAREDSSPRKEIGLLHGTSREFLNDLWARASPKLSKE